MAQRLIDPLVQLLDDASMIREGARLFFYLYNTSTKHDTYSDAGRTTPNTNPIVLNEFGQPSTAVFGDNVKYTIVLAGPDELGTDDPPTNIIRTIGPISGNDLDSMPVLIVGSGTPNGSVAGTAASAGVLPTQYWDYTNFVLYICTTTGSASTAVWTAVNASASTPAVPPPQGRLTLTSGARVPTGDVTAATTLYYTPAVGALVPIYNGATFTPLEFSELSLSLVASHAANTIYDCFVYNNSGVPIFFTGPAWATSTAGSGARGTGASTTQLTRIKGFDVNAVAMTGRNGSTTYSVGANLATYVGSILTDGSAGQLSAHVSWGTLRKDGVWNAYNRHRKILKGGDSTASWAYGTNTLRQSNNSSNSSLTVFCGLAEENIDLSFAQRVTMPTASSIANPQIAIGYNGVAVAGMQASGYLGHALGSITHEQTIMAQHSVPSLLGIATVSSLERALSGVSGSFYGTETYMNLKAVYWG